MENAIKALIMAATTILGVLLLYIMIYMFRTAAKVDQQYDENQAQRGLELENSEFEVYNNNYNTIMDLITVCNLAHSKNIETEYDIYIKVKITVDINGKTYEIPNEPKDTKGISKPIFLGNEPVSIYRLADSSLKDLKIPIPAGGKDTDKLSKTHTGRITYKINKYGESMWKCKEKGCGYISTGMNQPSSCLRCGRSNFEKTEMNEYVTVYKYLFECTGIKYYDKTNVVSEMNFKMITTNSKEAESILKWNSDWD